MTVMEYLKELRLKHRAIERHNNDFVKSSGFKTGFDFFKENRLVGGDYDGREGCWMIGRKVVRG